MKHTTQRNEYSNLEKRINFNIVAPLTIHAFNNYHLSHYLCRYLKNKTCLDSSIGNCHSLHKHVFCKIVFAPIGLALEEIGNFLHVFPVSKMTGGVEEVTVILGTGKKNCVFERRCVYSTA